MAWRWASRIAAPRCVSATASSSNPAQIPVFWERGRVGSNLQAHHGRQCPPEGQADLDPIPELFLQVTYLLNQYSSRAHCMAGFRSELAGRECTGIHPCVHTCALYEARFGGGVNSHGAPALSLISNLVFDFIVPSLCWYYYS